MRGHKTGNADYCLFDQKTLIRQFSNGEERLQKKQPIRNQDDSTFFLVLLELHSRTVGLLLIFWYSLSYPVLLKVYCSDHTYTTIRVAVAATGREVINAVADKLGSTDELLLVHHSSAGGKNGVEDQLTLRLLPAITATSCSLLRGPEQLTTWNPSERSKDRACPPFDRETGPKAQRRVGVFCSEHQRQIVCVPPRAARHSGRRRFLVLCRIRGVLTAALVTILCVRLIFQTKRAPLQAPCPRLS